MDTCVSVIVKLVKTAITFGMRTNMAATIYNVLICVYWHYQ